MNPDILTICTAKGVDFGAIRVDGSSIPQITREDILGGCTNLHDKYYWAAMAYVNGDLPRKCEVWEIVIDGVLRDLNRIGAHNWKCEPKDISNMVWLAYNELANYKIKTIEQRAKMLLIEPEEFFKFKGYYEDVFTILVDYANTVFRQIGKQLYE